ncbi:phosphate transport regulator [Stutzerimonas stutzeri]|uniref:Phosphate transport regulator n=2 Tax=Stutzerimonas stutzeri TaxID=316 RepID=A0A2N8T7T6_STUST|nr:phosphate transport regulator [Stutzerimonas stutzeri]
MNTPLTRRERCRMPAKYLSELIARSPFAQLQQHFAQVHAGAKLLLPFMRAAGDGDWRRAGQLEQQLQELRQEADRVARNLCLHLPGSLFMPVPRADLLDLLRVQSHLGTRPGEIARLVSLRQMSVPLPLQDGVRLHLARAVDAVAQAMALVDELDELLESGFRGREVGKVEAMLAELINLDEASKRRRDEAAGVLIGLENQLAATDVFALHRLIELIAELSEGARQVGLRLEQLVEA